ncbi:hypothetical protein ACG2F4_19100 [Halalkalibaculum sp. DA3122]|uniref:hypothetical protein n=1 Tax=Halalkalibaculum sp. DA3122 TaxID=3373607 RepID=UPI003753FE7D
METGREFKEQRYLTENLIRLLNKLKFSDIRVKSHSIYPDPDQITFPANIRPYTPSVVAQKNGFVYYFELVCDNGLDLTRLQGPLKLLHEFAIKKWNSALILVTSYGNKNAVEKTARQCKMPFDHIWEL